jgi:hypothetical protein
MTLYIYLDTDLHRVIKICSYNPYKCHYNLDAERTHIYYTIEMSTTDILVEEEFPELFI